MTQTLKKSDFTAFFQQFQQDVIARFTEIENSAKNNTATFTQTPWEKGAEDMLQGGGKMASMRGETFEKVGVNFSEVHGTFSEKFAKEIPGALESNGEFWASGVSLVAHMANPFAPAVHMNVRRIQTSKSWVGGGADLTPTFPLQEDTQTFHNALKQACENHHTGAYPKYKKWCDEYFFLPHRNETRGVGGVFFDNLHSSDDSKDLQLLKDVSYAFLDSFSEITERRMHTKFTTEDKIKQQEKRGRYVEFNLLYDRGTRFGFQTGGNAEAILMSMPPEARW